MKLVLFALMTLVTVNASAAEFCRTGGGGLGAPPNSTMQHCVTLEDGVLVDSANSFFGKPPESLPYKIVGSQIYVNREGSWEASYTILDSQTIVKGRQVLKRK